MKKGLLLFVFLVVPSLMAYSKDPLKGYRGSIDFGLGDAYNFNTAQTISTNNMQPFTMMSTSQGYVYNKWFVGAGLGYYHSYRDKEDLFPFFAVGRYTFESVKIKPNLEVRAGIMYDPLWVEKVQKYGAFSVGVNVYKGLHAALRASIFSRPSRFFTANVAFVVSYATGE